MRVVNLTQIQCLIRRRGISVNSSVLLNTGVNNSGQLRMRVHNSKPSLRRRKPENGGLRKAMDFETKPLDEAKRFSGGERVIARSARDEAISAEDKDCFAPPAMTS
jgi:hypothetical protein